MNTHILVFLLWYLCYWCLWQQDISRICVMFLRLNPRSLLRETDLSLIFLSSHGYSWKRLWGEFDLIADSGISHVLRISRIFKSRRLTRGKYKKTVYPKQWINYCKEAWNSFFSWRIKDHNRVLQNSVSHDADDTVLMPLVLLIIAINTS